MKKLSIPLIAFALLVGCKSTEERRAERQATIDKNLFSCYDPYAAKAATINGDNYPLHRIKQMNSVRYLDDVTELLVTANSELIDLEKLVESRKLNYTSLMHEGDKKSASELKSYCNAKNYLELKIEAIEALEVVKKEIESEQAAKHKAAKLEAKRERQRKAQQDRIEAEKVKARAEKRKRDYQLGYDHVMSKIADIKTLSDKQIKELYSMAYKVNSMATDGEPRINSQVLQTAYDDASQRERDKQREFESQFNGKVVYTCESYKRTVPVYYCVMGKNSTHGSIKVNNTINGYKTSDIFQYTDLSSGKKLSKAQCNSNRNELCILIGDDFFSHAQKGNQSGTVLKAKVYDKHGTLLSVDSVSGSFQSIIMN